MRTVAPRLAFNRGLISTKGMARADIARVAMASETQTNWIPRVLGSMSLRPGLQYIGATAGNNAVRSIPFVFSINDKAKIEISDVLMRVWIDDALVTRASVSTAVTNGDFDSDVTSWTDSDESGATSAWETGGYLALTGDGTAAAIRDQTLTVAAGDQSVEHALTIVIERGPVYLRVGSSAGDDDFISETVLNTGTHSLAFTPTGDAYVRFFSRLKRKVLVDSCNVESSGTMTVTAPWAEADLGLIRYAQSADVIFVACGKVADNVGYQQYRIERRATRSWSVVKYYANDGPMQVENVGPITMTATALSGNTTLTASKAYFKSTNVGSLFRLNSNGQAVTASISAENNFTNAIQVEGVDNQRIFNIAVDEDSGGSGTFTLQRSLVGDAGPWSDVEQYTADTTKTFDDGLDNQIAWYRLGVKTGDYGSGTHTCDLTYTVGSIAGYCRVTAYTSATVVSVEVISDFGGTDATDSWSEGQWSDRRGWPTAAEFHEGRLSWHGRDKTIHSISDAYDSFDEDFLGDAGTINRSIAFEGVDTINWAISLQRLILGGDLAEYSIRSSSLDEPLTPTNFNPKRAGTSGATAVEAVQEGDSCIFVTRGGTRIYELAWGQSGVDYEESHLSALVPEIGQPGIVRIAVQRQPDPRIHFVRSDGKVAVLVRDRVENVIAFILVETDGTIEDVVVLPGDTGSEEDQVYYVVNRTINGATVRYYEKWAKESESVGGTTNKQADAFVTFTQSASSTITGLTHLIGESVVVWADGKCLADSSGDIATFTVDGSGEITVTHLGSSYSATTGMVGVGYTGSYKSARIVEIMSQSGSTLMDTQKIQSLALLLENVHHYGMKFGYSLTASEMRDLPQNVNGANVTADTIHSNLSLEPLATPHGYSEDTRICLLAQAPRPVTVLAAIAEVEHHG